ncbi:hypothetical protein [Streptomyces sp. NPDC000405]|uniref:hypothetical protein n=1 Tax=Streptomyces sp. NPDC000405 TaxID=3161033 RepID=UPI00398D495D
MVYDEQCRMGYPDHVTVQAPREGAFTALRPPTRPSLPDSIYLLDDSGNADMSFFGFIRVPWVQGWSDVHVAWTAFLEKLQVNPHFTYGAGGPLHAVDLVAGRGRLLHPEAGPAPTNRQKSAAAQVVFQGLEALAKVPGLAVGAVYRHGATREDLYADLVEMLNNQHAHAGTSCQFIVDGNGTERALRAAHRRLPADRRHILGDPLLVPARQTPILQAADFVTHAAFQSVARHPRRSFMWDWYLRVFPEAGAPMNLGRV